MRSRLIRAHAMLTVGLLCASCDGPSKVESYWAPGAGLETGWASYAWAAKDQSNVPRKELDQLLHQLIDERLSQKGYIKAEHSKPDLYLRIRVAKWVQQAETGTDSWDQAVLAIEMMDPLNHALVWRGSAELRVEYSLTPEKRRDRAAKVVQAILKKFPSRRER